MRNAKRFSSIIIEDWFQIPNIGRTPEISKWDSRPFLAGNHWFYDKLIAADNNFDPSVFPASGGYGGIKAASCKSYSTKAPNNQKIEFPLTIADFLNLNLFILVKWYLSLLPYKPVRNRVHKEIRKNFPLVYYVNQPGIDINYIQYTISKLHNLKSYVKQEKLRISLLYEFNSIRAWIIIVITNFKQEIK